jgi:hypothetical protein
VLRPVQKKDSREDSVSAPRPRFQPSLCFTCAHHSDLRVTISRARGCGRRGTYILCGMQGSVSRGTHRITAHMSGDAGEVHGGLLSGRTIAGNGCEICLMELPGLSFERPSNGPLVVHPAGASSAADPGTAGSAAPAPAPAPRNSPSKSIPLTVVDGAPRESRARPEMRQWGGVDANN